MKRLFAILFALFCTMPLFCQDREVDSLLRVLDASVQGRERYTLERQSQINALQCQLKATRSDAELLEIYQELFGKYSAYRMDSALWAANRCVEVAQRMPVASHLYSARMRVAEVMIGTGMYKEGLEILEDIPQEELGAIDMFYYYNLYHKVYTYAFSEELQASYSRLAYQYKDSILRVKRPDSQGYQLTLGDKLLYEGKYDEAIGVLEGCYDIHSQKDFSLAIPSVALASVYGAKGDHKQEKKYLTISAIADVQSGTKEYISLWKLANLLYGENVRIPRWNAPCKMLPSVMLATVRWRFRGCCPSSTPPTRPSCMRKKNSWSPYLYGYPSWRQYCWWPWSIFIIR